MLHEKLHNAWQARERAADEEDAGLTHKLFEDADKGREYITIVHVPWTTGGDQ